MRTKKTIGLILLSLAVLLASFAMGEAAQPQTQMDLLVQQLELLLPQLGFESMDEALAAFGVETPEELIQIGMAALASGTIPGTDNAEAGDEPTEDAEPERTFDGKIMATMEIEASAEEIKYFFQTLLEIPIADFITFPTAAEALLALKSGKVDTLLSTDSTATYMAQQDETLYTYMDPRLKDFTDISLSLVVMQSKEELGVALNEALAELREEGVLDHLAATLFGGTPQEAEPVTNPTQTLRVGVTGDLPPVDYVNEAGEPMGYNVTLMRHIAEKLNADIEFVNLTKAAATMALATGRIDIFFWQEQSLSPEMQTLIGGFSDQIFITDPYLELHITAIELQ